MSTGKKDTPGIILFPPLIYFGFMAMGVAGDWFFPVALLPDAVQYSVGFVLIAASGAIVLFALYEFRQAKTSFDVRKPASSLVTTGVYRLSRNPGYLALTMIYIGIAIAADSVWILVLIVPTLVVMRNAVIVREERYLEREFGDKYLRYRRSVRRWL